MDEYYVNFESAVEWASADSTCFYFYIQAINGEQGNAFRIKLGAPNASPTIQNRTNGANITQSGSRTTSLSVAGSVNRVERTWFGDDVAGSADWDTISMNWDGGDATYADGDLVFFDESFDGLSSDINLVGVLEPLAITVSNTSGGSVPEYTFLGSGALSGSTNLLKEGSGTLTLANTDFNDYSGGTTIAEGTLQIGLADGLPIGGDLTIGGGSGVAEFRMNGFDQTIANLFAAGENPRRVVNGSATATVLTVANGGVYSGQLGDPDLAATDDNNNFRVVKTGPGSLILTGASGFSGNVTVNEGIYRISRDNGLGAVPDSPTPDAIVLNGGILQTHLTSGTGGSFEIDANRLITLGEEGGTILNSTPSGAFRATYNGVISGPGSLFKTAGQTLVLGGENTYLGSTTVTGGILEVNGSALPDGGALILSGGRVRPIGTEVVDSLFFGDELQAAGTWGATDSGADNIDDARFNGSTGVVSVTNGPAFSPFQLWATANIVDIDPDAAAGFEDDPDGDGLDNGLEWILGGNPLNSSLVDVLAELSGDVTTGLTLVFERNPDTIGVTSLAVEWDPSLPGFANSIPIDGNVAPNGDEPTVTIVGDEVSVSIPGSNATDGKIFARFTATEL